MALGTLGEIIESGLQRKLNGRWQSRDQAPWRSLRYVGVEDGNGQTNGHGLKNGRPQEKDPLKKLLESLDQEERAVLFDICRGEVHPAIRNTDRKSPPIVETQCASLNRKIRKLVPNFPGTTGRLIRIGLALGVTRVRTITARGGARLTPVVQLSDGEFQLLLLVGRGSDNKEIAEALNIPIGRVEDRRKKLTRRLSREAFEKIDGLERDVVMDTTEIIHLCLHERLVKPFTFDPWLKAQTGR
ncbi:MAG: hypothetical protein AAB391_00345 [Patescibacteria group bacterium]